MQPQLPCKLYAVLADTESVVHPPQPRGDWQPPWGLCVHPVAIVRPQLPLGVKHSVSVIIVMSMLLPLSPRNY